MDAARVRAQRAVRPVSRPQAGHCCLSHHRFAGTMPFRFTIPRFADVYELGSRLGGGAYAEVFTCVCRPTEKKFAVKLFKRGYVRAGTLRPRRRRRQRRA